MTASDVMTRTTAGLGASPAHIAVRAEEAVKVYGKGDTVVRALDGVSLALPAGRFTAIMGPSGSGKSTLMHCLAGLDTLTSGRVFVGEVDLGRLSDKELTRLRRDHVGFVFQAFNLLPMLTAGENINLPLALAGRKVDKRWIQGVVETVGLGDRLKHRPAELSGGQQQRVAVARALASRPSVIFADEPTGNLDSHSGGEILAFMRRAVDELGQTMVMVTHDPVAASHADAVVFLADGRVVDQMAAPTAARVLERLRGLATAPDPGPERPGAEHRERETQRRSPSGPSPQATRAGSTAEFGS
jgi:putative ABC transport system ATP-binding protein